MFGPSSRCFHPRTTKLISLVYFAMAWWLVSSSLCGRMVALREMASLPCISWDTQQRLKAKTIKNLNQGPKVKAFICQPSLFSPKNTCTTHSWLRSCFQACGAAEGCLAQGCAQKLHPRGAWNHADGLFPGHNRMGTSFGTKLTTLL